MAPDDIEALTAFIAASDVEAAIATGHTLLAKTRRIPLNPRAARNDPRIRQVLHGNYRIINQLPEQIGRIEIMRIWSGARAAPTIP